MTQEILNRLDSHERRLSDHDQRITHCAGEVTQMAKQVDVLRLVQPMQVEMEKMRVTVERTEQQIGQLADALKEHMSRLADINEENLRKQALALEKAVEDGRFINRLKNVYGPAAAFIVSTGGALSILWWIVEYLVHQAK
jgi:acetolactate synthase small subunit